MTKEQINEYTLKITQASRGELIVILYDLADIYLKEAIDNFDDHEVFREKCKNAENVVRELRGALNLDYELSHNLYSIYEFIGRQISMAVIKNDTKGLHDSVRLLASLRESFEKIAKEDKSGPMMGNTQSVYAGLTYGKGVLNESIQTEDNRGFKV